MKDVKNVKQNFHLDSNVKELREKLGWSQAKLAKALGVRRATISEWECGKSNPREIIIGLKLGILLLRKGCDTEDLILSLPEDC